MKVIMIIGWLWCWWRWWYDGNVDGYSDGGLNRTTTRIWQLWWCHDNNDYSTDLYRQGLKEEFLEELFLGALTQDYCLACTQPCKQFNNDTALLPVHSHANSSTMTQHYCLHTAMQTVQQWHSITACTQPCKQFNNDTASLPCLHTTV